MGYFAGLVGAFLAGVIFDEVLGVGLTACLETKFHTTEAIVIAAIKAEIAKISPKL